VEFDDAEVRVRVLADLDAEWNQTFQWSNITRVCFKDGGIDSSDVVYVSLNDRQKPAVSPTEARGGHEFFGALCDRGYFPESEWRAVGTRAGDCIAGRPRTAEGHRGSYLSWTSVDESEPFVERLQRAGDVLAVLLRIRPPPTLEVE
jgi:hypothetical protein